MLLACWKCSFGPGNSTGRCGRLGVKYRGVWTPFMQWFCNLLEAVNLTLYCLVASCSCSNVAMNYTAYSLVVCFSSLPFQKTPLCCFVGTIIYWTPLLSVRVLLVAWAVKEFTTTRRDVERKCILLFKSGKGRCITRQYRAGNKKRLPLRKSNGCCC